MSDQSQTPVPSPDSKLVPTQDGGEVALLRRLAEETGGRDAARLNHLADRMDRGEDVSTTEILQDPIIIDSPCAVGAYLAISSHEPSLGQASLNATRHEMAKSMRRKLSLCVLAGLAYVSASLLVGFGLFAGLAPIASELVSWNWWSQPQEIGGWSMQLVETIYAVLLQSTIVVMALFVWRVVFAAPRWLVKVFDVVPLVGSTLRAIDLAEMTHSLYQCVLNQQTYAEAFELTAIRIKSSSLKHWLLESAQELRSGQGVRETFRRMPVQGEWLSGWTEVAELNAIGEHTSDLWSVSSDRMFAVAAYRTERACQIIPTLLVVISAAVASIAIAILLNQIIKSLESMSWF